MASNDGNPKSQASRPADITENIHRAIAWIYNDSQNWPPPHDGSAAPAGPDMRML